MKLALSFHGNGVELRPVVDAIPGELEPSIEASKLQIVEYVRNSGRRETGSAEADSADASSLRAASASQQRTARRERSLGAGEDLICSRQIVLDGAVSEEIIQRAFDQLLERHAWLTSRFLYSAGQLVRYESRTSYGAFRRIDLADVGEENQEDACLRVLRERQSRIDFAIEAPFRLDVARCAASRVILQFSAHQIVCTGTRLDALVREFLDLCSTPMDIRAQPAVAVTGDAVTDDDRVDLRDLSRAQWAYWDRLLAGLPAIHSLGIPPAEECGTVTECVRFRHRIDAGVSAAVKELAGRHSVSIAAVLQATFGLLLARFANESEVALHVRDCTNAPGEGEPPAVRERPLICRSRYGDDRTAIDLFLRTAAELQEALARQDPPLDVIEELLFSEKFPGTTALPRIAFLFRGEPASIAQVAGARSTPGLGTESFAGTDLELVVDEVDGQWIATWVYRTDKFDRDRIDALNSSLCCLLASAVARPDDPPQELPLLDAQEQAKLLALSTGPEALYPAACIHELFEQQARRVPREPAVRVGAAEITYHELNRRANQLAHYLRDRGVGPDVLVGLCVQPSIEMVIGLIAILKAGGAYVPIDPALPAERLEHILRQSSPRLILTSAEQKLPPGQEGAFCLETQSREIDSLNEENIDVRSMGLGASHLAYVIFTSGSTGRPKGVMIPHGSIVNYSLDMADRFDVRRGNGSLVATSLSFDLALTSFFPALICGKVVHLCGADSDLADLSEILGSRQDLSPVKLTPSHLSALQETLADRDITRAVRTLVLGGEVLPAKSLAWWRERAPATRIFNHYGPTETTVGCIVTEVTSQASGAVALGRPIANTRVYILDARLQPVPRGVAGEIYIAGSGLARGYLNDPALTADRFIDDPFLGAPAKMYRSGDLARWSPTGDVEFLGRADSQVKVRGYRIELGEIETRLREIGTVQEAVVVVDAQKKAGPRLVAYLVPRGEIVTAGGTASDAWASECRASLTRVLPHYMVPETVVVLSAIPLTGNGKVDYRSLASHKVAAADDQVAPRNAAERTLAEIWRRLLNTERVGVTESFFALGGDSVLAIQMASQAKRAGLSLSARDVFQNPTIAALAALAATAQRRVTAIHVRESVSGTAVLLPIQKQFLYEQPDCVDHYNQSVLLDAPEGLTEEATARICAALLERHEALRLRFRRQDAEWVATFASADAAMVEAACAFETLLSGEPDPEGLIEARCAFHQQSLDLERGPLSRFVRFEIEGRVRLFVVVHHLAVDGVSWRILLSDLLHAFWQLEHGGGVQRDQRGTSLQEWGRFVAGYAASAPVRQEVGYWATQLACETGAAIVKPVLCRHESTRELKFNIAEADTTRLLTTCNRAYGTSAHELLLASVYMALRRFTGKSALRIDIEGHGRDVPSDSIDIAETVGWFTAVYPLKLAAPSDDLGETLCAIKESCRGVPNGGIGYGLLRYLSEDAALIAAENDSEPLFLFNYLGQFDQALAGSSGFSLSEGDVGASMSPKRLRRYPLSLVAMVLRGVLELRLNYSSDQFEEAEMQALQLDITRCLRATIEGCAAAVQRRFTLSDFPNARVDAPLLAQWQEQFPIENLYVVTPLQRGMLFHGLLDSSAYVTQVCLKLNLDDASAIQEAWRALIRRHEVFRTCFAGDGGDWHQVVCRTASLPWQQEDWSSVSEPEQQLRLEQLRLADAVRGFSIDRAPLMRVTVVKLAPGKHWMLWTHHHALLDGWSIPIVYREFLALLGDSKALAPPANSVGAKFEDYVAWLLAQDVQVAREFWKKKLAPVEEPTTLRVLKPRPRPGTARGGVLHELGPGFTARLRKFAREKQVTLSTLLQFSWAVLLSLYSGQRKVLFGAVTSGREDAVRNVDVAVGLFINTIPVLVDLDRENLDGLIRELHRDFHDSTQHAYLGLADIQKLAPLGGNVPLFESLLVFENYPQGSEFGRLSSPFSVVEEVRAHFADSYPLTIAVFENESISFTCNFSASEFDERQVQDLLHQFSYLLEQLPSCTQLAELRLLRPGQHSVAAARGAAARVFSVERRLDESFVGQVERTPDALAVVLEDIKLTYRELNARANRLAHCLRDQGVGPDTLVGLCVERSVAMLVGILGILKAGGAYVPLDPGYPQERLDFMVRDSGMKLLLKDSSVPWQQDADIPVLVLDDESLEQALSRYSDENPRALAGQSPDNLAYIIYTSGSTGVPKGVLIEHRQVERLLSATREQFQFCESDVWTLFHSFAFDFSVWEIWGALAYGGRLVVVPRWIARSPEDFHGLLCDQRVTVLNQTPTAFMQLARVDAQKMEQSGGSTPARGLALRVVVFGGEALNLGELRAWVERHGDDHPALVNMYGITETTVHVTYRRIRREDIVENRGSVIGRPLADLSLYVLDRYLHPVPVGTPGELFVGGGGVGRGYLNREALTAERFIPNPFSSDQNERLYRTGDLGRYLEDGDLEYLGRIDAQVKIRGFRIELGEIESALSGLDGVTASAVLVREDAPGQKRLVAYVVAGAGPAGAADSADLASWREQRIGEYRQALQARLPHYMVPAAFVSLDALPLTTNGKVDRRALPAPEESAELAEYFAPRDDIERALCAVWAEALGRERVGIRDNFFSIGGDSILSIRVVSLLRARGLKLDIRDLFEHQSIGELSARVRLAEAKREELQPFELLTEKERERIAADPQQFVDAYPLSALQAGMVFHTQLEQFSGIYHDIMSQHVRCTWDQSRFAQALASCIAEHPILRSSFSLQGERPLQRVHAARPLPLWVEDLRARSAEEQQRHLGEWMEERKHLVFDWEQDALFAIHIFRRTDESFQFIVSFHHAVLDGWSRAVLTTDLYNRYERLLAGQPLAEAAVNWTYRDFIAQEQAVLADPAARAHFREMLEDAPIVQVPRLAGAAPPPGAPTQGRCALESFPALSGQLIELARQMGVPVQAVLLAVHFKVLSVLSGQPVALSCVTHNGRPESPGAERAVGLFLNSLPIAIPLGSGSWRELIQDIAKASAQTLPYRSYPLSRIQQDQGRTFSEVTFNYTHFHVYNEIAAWKKRELELLDLSWFEQINFEFYVAVTHSLDADSLELTYTYDTRVYAPALIERIGTYYLKGFESLIADPDGAHRYLSLLSDSERLQQLVWWNDTAQELRWKGCLHDAIDEQARRTPDAIAVRYRDQTLSYRELNEKAGRLAGYLQSAGVQLEERVGVYLERGLEQPIAMLGILKSGAAYVPLDPAYPAQRIEYVLQDAQICRVLIRSELLDRLPGSGVDVVSMDDAAGDDAWLQEYTERAKTAARADARSLAYVLYTSGSTGRPKGVMVEHAGLMNYLGHAARAYRLQDLDGAVVSTPLGFDATVTSLWTPLLLGKTVLMLTEGDHLIDQLLQKLYEDDSRWLFKVTPAHLEALEHADSAKRIGAAAHRLVIGGEQLRVQTVREWQRRLPQAVLINEYGPTETVVGCAVYEVTDADQLTDFPEQAGVPIGRPIANTSLYVLSESRQPQPVGSAGELFIGGAGVARGYLNQDELTAERFIADPFSTDPGARLYRSGDRVRWHPDGQLEYLGRTDEQVKIRGFRIELGEIESQLRDLAGVRAAVVLVREDEPGQRRLVAYVVAEGSSADASWREQRISACREALELRLPRYMVPAAFVLLDSLPLTANGKVDRKALTAPVDGTPTADYQPPRSEMEQALCSVWSEVLGRERVGIRESFFSIGGDSILSIRVVSLLKAQGLTISIRDLFEHQSIAELAAHVQSGRAMAGALAPFELLTEEEREALRESPEEFVDAYPLSALQAGMVFHSQLEQFSGIYHDVMTQHVKCAWHEEKFQEALASCIGEHPILRSSFSLEGARPLQRVHASRPLPLWVEDLRPLDAGRQQQHLAHWMGERKRHAFDWEEGALFGIHIFRRTDESFQFIVSFHHAVLDGWSRAVLTTELYRRYQQLLAGEELAPIPVNWTYREFIAQEQSVLTDTQARAHFERMLDEAPGSQLPRAARAPSGTPTQGRWVLEPFTELSGRLIDLAKTLGLPVQTLLLTVHLKVLSVLSGQSVAMTCVTQNGRPESAGAERAVGLFLNSLPLALTVTSGSWRELVQAVAKLSTHNLAYRRYPLSKIQQDLGRGFSEVLFNYTHFHIYDEIAGDRRSDDSLQVLETAGFEQTNFDLLVDFMRTFDGRQMRLAFVFDSRSFDASEVARWGGYYQRAFVRLLEDMDQPHEHSLLGDEERHRQLVQWNDTARAYPTHLCIHQLIEQQVARTPDAVAVEFEGTELTYQELNARANQLAHYLRELGVRPDGLVGLCVERSVEMLVGILGILKAGGAYVPLDPSYPEDRLAFMIEDSAPTLLLIQSTLEQRFTSFPRPQISLDTTAALAGFPTHDPGVDEIGLRPDNLAYVIYTSGSTGRPKGVMNEHGALVNRLLWARDEYSVDHTDRILQKTPFSFDVSVWELLLPLIAGAREIVARPDGHLDPSYLADVIVRHEVSMVHFVPAMLQVFLDGHGQSDFPQLRRVICSGEALPYALQMRWLERHPGIELHNLYGPTEAAIDVTAWHCVADEHEGIVPIGRPISNTQMHVLDSRGQLAPTGVAGELYIGGRGVARGYWNNPSLTQERFVPDRFIPEKSARLYRTGDLGRWLPDGAIEYLGRNDSQVKIRGFRIELGEIEHRLRELTGVREAIVVAREEAPGDPRLVAYVVPDAASRAVATLSTEQRAGGYRQALLEQLPQHMIPAAFVILEALPLNANGKVDRKALPAPTMQAGAEHVGPDTPTEQALTQIWAELLSRDASTISVNASFFELGGHSLMLMRMSTQIKARFVRSPSLREIYEAMTIRHLGQSLDLQHTKTRLDEELARRAASEIEEMEFD